MRRALRWVLVAVIGVSLIALSSDARHFNPAQREGAPYLYNITLWEVNNALDKWQFKVMGMLRGDGAASWEQDTRGLF